MNTVKPPELDLGMGGHHRGCRGDKDEWLTPPHILEACGPFDLDPAAPCTPPWPTATRMLNINDDGLTSQWGAGEFVWLNPPYGPVTWTWLDRLAEHPAGGIALIFARTETAGFVETVWERASSLLFLHGRVTFHHVDGSRAEANGGAPSVLCGYGTEAKRRLHDAHHTKAVAGTLVHAGRWEAA